MINAKKTVVATGGGSVLISDNVNLFKKIGKLIYLYVPYEILLERILQGRLAVTFLDSKNPEKSFMKMYEDEKSIYENIADYQVDAFDRGNDEIVDEIVKLV